MQTHLHLVVLVFHVNKGVITQKKKKKKGEGAISRHNLRDDLEHLITSFHAITLFQMDRIEHICHLCCLGELQDMVYVTAPLYYDRWLE